MLEIKGMQEFMGIEVPNIYGGFTNGGKCVLAKTIAEIHGVELKKINELINGNINNFIFGIDLIDIKHNEEIKVVARDLNMSNKFISNSINIYLLSERGYIKLVSAMSNNNSKKWEIMNKFIDNYFTMREYISNIQRDIIHRTKNYNIFIGHEENRIDIKHEPTTSKYKKLKKDIEINKENDIPIIVNEIDKGQFKIISGHNRFLACKNTNSEVRYIINNNYTLAKAIEQENIQGSKWKNKEVYNRGLLLNIPLCNLIQEIYDTKFNTITSITNVAQLVCRVLSRREFKDILNIEGNYYSTDTFWKKLQEQEGIKQLQQIEVTEHDKEELYKLLDKFYIFYTNINNRIKQEEINHFIEFYSYINVYWNTINKNWNKVKKHKDNYKYSQVRECYRNIRKGNRTDYQSALIFLAEMNKLK